MSDITNINLVKKGENKFVAKIDGQPNIDVDANIVNPLIQNIVSKQNESQKSVDKSISAESAASNADIDTYDKDNAKAQENVDAATKESRLSDEEYNEKLYNEKLTIVSEDLNKWLNEQKKGVSEIFGSFKITDTTNENNFIETAPDFIRMIGEYNAKNNSKVVDLLKQVHEDKSVFSSKILDRSEEWLSKLYERIKSDVSGRYLRFLSYQEVEILTYILRSVLDKGDTTPVFWTKEFIIYLYDKIKSLKRLTDEISMITANYDIQFEDLLKQIIVLYFSSIYGIFVLKDNKLEIYRDTTKMNVMMNYKYININK